MRHTIILILSSMPAICSSMNAPLSDSLKIKVFQSKGAARRLMLASNANINDLAEKLHTLANIPHDQPLIIFPILAQLLFFEVHGKPLAHIQLLKDAIVKYKTNKFFVSYKQ